MIGAIIAVTTIIMKTTINTMIIMRAHLTNVNHVVTDTLNVHDTVSG